jgi:hypothetical protein
MKTRIAMACLLLGAQPAWACHRFSKWYYPYPQRCSVSQRVAYEVDKEPAKIIPEVFPPIKPDEEIVVTIPSVPQAVTPLIIFPILEDWNITERQAALTKLRLIQQGKWSDK